MTYCWTTKELDDLEAFYWTEIAPVMQEDDLDPEADRPPHAWMTEHGFSGLMTALLKMDDSAGIESVLRGVAKDFSDLSYGTICRYYRNFTPQISNCGYPISL